MNKAVSCDYLSRRLKNAGVLFTLCAALIALSPGRAGAQTLDTTLGPQIFGVQGSTVGSWSASQLSVNNSLSVGGAAYARAGLVTYGQIYNTYGGSAEILVNGDNHTGGGIAISDDGGFYDYNNGWVTFNGSTGLLIAGNSGPASTGGQLFVTGIGSFTSNVNISGALSVGSTITAAAYYHQSDARLKTSIHPIDGALDKLLAIRGVEFNWKKDGRPDMGVVAQNVAEIFPNVVTHDANGVMAVEYDSLVGPMIESIRQLKAENDDLRRKVDALDTMKAQMTRISAGLDALQQENARLRSIKSDAAALPSRPLTVAP